MDLEKRMNKYLCLSKTENVLRVFYENYEVSKEKLEHSHFILYQEPRFKNDGMTLDLKYVFSTYTYEFNDSNDISDTLVSISSKHFKFDDSTMIPKLINSISKLRVIKSREETQLSLF